MLQQTKPRDYVISTGKQVSVRTFVEKASQIIGIKLRWSGKGINEVGIVEEITNNSINKIRVGDVIVRIDKRYYRPTEVDTLLGDSSKAKKELGWKTKISLEDMITEMIDFDMNVAKKEQLLEKNGFW